MSSDVQLREELGEAAQLFQGEYPILVHTCFEKGLLPIFVSHVTRVYLRAKRIEDRALIEGILGVALYHCENDYCYLVHSARLLGMGLPWDDVAGLFERLEAPRRIADRRKWSLVLRATYFAFLEDKLYIPNLKNVRTVLDPDEYEDYAHVLALAAFLRGVLSAYPNEIDKSREPLFRHEGATHPNVARLLKLSQVSLASRMTDSDSQGKHILSICMYCKDVKIDEDRWAPIEMCLSELGPDSVFSHGLCSICFEDEMERMA